MKNTSKKRRGRIDAKRSALGRFLCRLLGDTAGQALMEYVVIGVLIVAAAVAAAVLFGDSINYNFQIMYYSIIGNQEKVKELKEQQKKEIDSGTQEVDAYHDETNGKQ